MKNAIPLRVHVKVLRADSHNVITQMVNKFVDTLYMLNSETEIISIDTNITPGSRIDATIVFRSSVYDGSGIYDISTLENMIKAVNPPVAVL